MLHGSRSGARLARQEAPEEASWVSSYMLYLGTFEGHQKTALCLSIPRVDRATPCMTVPCARGHDTQTHGSGVRGPQCQAGNWRSGTLRSTIRDGCGWCKLHTIGRGADGVELFMGALHDGVSLLPAQHVNGLVSGSTLLAFSYLEIVPTYFSHSLSLL